MLGGRPHTVASLSLDSACSPCSSSIRATASRDQVSHATVLDEPRQRVRLLAWRLIQLRASVGHRPFAANHLSTPRAPQPAVRGEAQARPSGRRAPQPESESRDQRERRIAIITGCHTPLAVPEIVHVDVPRQRGLRLPDGRAPPFALELAKSTEEDPMRIGGPRTPADVVWKQPGHRLAEQPLGPVFEHQRLRRQSGAELDQPPVAERVPRLDPRGGRDPIAPLEGGAERQPACEPSVLRERRRVRPLIARVEAPGPQEPVLGGRFDQQTRGEGGRAPRARLAWRIGAAGRPASPRLPVGRALPGGPPRAGLPMPAPCGSGLLRNSEQVRG